MVEETMFTAKVVPLQQRDEDLSVMPREWFRHTEWFEKEQEEARRARRDWIMGTILAALWTAAIAIFAVYGGY